MKHLKTLSALMLAAVVAVPGLALAQNNDDHRDPHQGEQRQEDDHGHPPAPAHAPGPAHAWHKGDRLPTNYRSNQYVVSDWKARHLRQPPRGYHWVNVNGDYVLAAVATGVIADLLLNN